MAADATAGQGPLVRCQRTTKPAPVFTRISGSRRTRMGAGFIGSSRIDCPKGCARSGRWECIRVTPDERYPVVHEPDCGVSERTVTLSAAPVGQAPLKH